MAYKQTVDKIISKHYSGVIADDDLKWILSQPEYNDRFKKYILHWYRNELPSKRRRYILWQRRYRLGASDKKMRLLFGYTKEYDEWRYSYRSKRKNYIEYWIHLGFSESEAKSKVSAFQSKWTVESIMVRRECDAEEARLILDGFAIKAKSTWDNKPIEEKINIGKSKTNNLAKCISKYGLIEGTSKWEYILLQKNTNGLDTLCAKHGAELGRIKFDKISENIRKGSKFTIVYWDNLYPDDHIKAYECHRKACLARSHFSLRRCISELGEIEGQKRFDDRNARWVESLHDRSDEDMKDILRRRQVGKNSKSSVNFFDRLMSSFPELKYETWRNGGELCLKRIDKERSWYLYDFYCPSINLILEFHGRYWHEENDINDIIKAEYAISNGYNFYSFFDDDEEAMRNCYNLINRLKEGMNE
jgi:hypothetical protein